MHSGPEPFDSPDVQALVEAQQEEMRGRYDGVGDIGPAREGRMFEALEAEARRLGYMGIVLETGNRNPEAVGLYVSADTGRSRATARMPRRRQAGALKSGSERPQPGCSS